MSAWGGNNQAQVYSYDGSGQRIKRVVDGVDTWHVYGFGGELLAEYPANGSAPTPQKEYGYRNGQLLITTGTASQSLRQNFALRSNGSSASASSEIAAACSTWPARGAIDGDRKGSYWGNNGGWADSTSGSFSNDWFQVDFDSAKTIDELDIFTLQDNPNSPSEPTEAMTFSVYGLTAYSVSYWNGSAWINIPEATVAGNNKVWRKFTFAPIITTKIRVYPQSAVDNGYSRLTEVEAWGSVSMPAQTNVALRSNGAVVTASSEFSAGCETWPARGANDGDHKGAYWGGTGGWADATVGDFTNDWLQIDFSGSKTLHEIDVFTLQDNYANPVEPTETTTSTIYGLTAFDVSYWNESSWVQIPETIVTGNNKIWRKLTFSPITTTKIRVYGRGAIDNGRSRIVEVEAWSATESSGGNGVQWLVSDHLGTPRMVLDQTGSVAGMKRHDYLPFGEELFAPLHGRTISQGYASGDGIRQQFTQYERDIETGLDYAQARYFANVQGRFTGVDPLMSSAKPPMPQSWNRYAYCLNNPLLFIDPTGLTWYEKKGSNQPQWFDENPGDDYEEVTKFIYQAVDGTWVLLDSNSNKWWGGYASLQEAAFGGSLLTDPIRNLDYLFKQIKSDFDRFIDDPLGRGGLGDPAFMMLGAPGPLSQFGSISNATKEGTTTLYRAVLQNELDDIAAAGAYRLPQGQAEVKGFFSTAEEAAGFARKMFQRAPGEGAYTITSTTVPNSFLRGNQWQHIAGEGNAMFLRTMPSGPVKVFNFSPNPNFKF